MRLNNTIFECALEKGKLYNALEIKPFAISVIAGVMRTPQGNIINMQNVVICEKCYKENLNNKSADKLNFQDPSELVLPNPGIIQKLNHKKN